MARIRSIKPEIWTDEKFVELTPMARLLFIGLWNFADDEGRMEYSPRRIKMQIFPADPVEPSELFGEIRRNKMVEVYEVDGKEFLQITNFSRHQKIDKRSASKLPKPPSPAEIPRVTPTEGIKEGIKDGKGEEGSVPTGTGASAALDLTDNEAVKRACYKIATEIGRRPAPTELIKTGMSWAEVYATLVTARTKGDPPSYIATTIRNRGPGGKSGGPQLGFGEHRIRGGERVVV